MESLWRIAGWLLGGNRGTRDKGEWPVSSHSVCLRPPRPVVLATLGGMPLEGCASAAFARDALGESRKLDSGSRETFV